MPDKKIISIILVLTFLFFLNDSYAAPCYGTRLPEKNKIDLGLQNYTILKRYQENDLGKLRSIQDFLLLSYGVFDWLSIDLKEEPGILSNILREPMNFVIRRISPAGTGFVLNYSIK